MSAGRATWKAYLAAVREQAGDAGRRAVVAGAAAALGRAVSWRPRQSLELARWTPAAGVAALDVPDALAGPGLLGRVLEAVTDPVARRADGAHYTPAPLAAGLLEAALVGVDERTLVPVCDPACGGGAFLLVAADRLAVAGLAPGTVVGHQLWGVDLDPVAVAVADASLACWAWLEGDRSGAHPGGHLAVTDALADPDPWAAVGAPDGFGLVVGNPPFQGQLGRATARSPAATAELRARFGPAVGAYTDAAALFLLAATRLARPGGRIALILPSSILAARDASAARAACVADADLVGLWVAAEPVFAAGVRVCAPILARRAVGAGPEHAVSRWRGASFEALPAAAAPADASGWAALALAAHGVPEVAVRAVAGRVGDLASATAGFRDQFYGLVPYVAEAPGDAGPDHLDAGLAPLVTTGLVDLGAIAWGRRPARFAGRTWQRPAVDLAALRAGAPGLGRWVDERLVPKALVASQTRVGEVVVDWSGRWVPSVPLVAITAPAEHLARLGAVVAAPVTAALGLARSGGTALSDGALKLSARQVLDLPLPGDEAAWAEGTAALAAGDLDGFGAAMTAAYGLPTDHPVVAWWRARLPAT